MTSHARRASGSARDVTPECDANALKLTRVHEAKQLFNVAVHKALRHSQ